MCEDFKETWAIKDVLASEIFDTNAPDKQHAWINGSNCN